MCTVLQENISDSKSIATNLGVVSYFTVCSPEKAVDNEDAIAIIQPDNESLVLAVADGVGGQPSGAQASNSLVRSIKKACASYKDDNMELRDALLSGIEKANNEIIGLNIGAATTLAAVEIHNSFIRTYHVGDSAILVVGQRGKLILETVLHSPTGYAVESGLMSEDEALQHEDRNIVSNVIAQKICIFPMSMPVKLKKFDTVLLATDGLIDNIDKVTIIESIRKGPLQYCLSNMCNIINNKINSEDPSYKADDTSCILFRRNN